MDTNKTIPAGEGDATLSHHHRRREIRRDWPDGQGGALAETSELEPVWRGALDDRELVQLRASRLIGIVGVRACMDSLGWLDLASTDVLIRVVGVLERQLWTVRGERAL